MPATLSCIAVVSADADHPGKYLIGAGGSMPWHFPSDLRWFRQQTMGKPVLMGAKTFASLDCKPLPGRHNIVVSRSSQYSGGENLSVFTALEEAVEFGLQRADSLPEPELMVMGGGEIYAQLLDRCDRLYMTRIEHAYRGDTHFPDLNPDCWRTSFEKTVSESGVRLRFYRYERRVPQ